MGTKRRDDRLVHGGKEVLGTENRVEDDESNSFSVLEVTMDDPMHNSSIAAQSKENPPPMQFGCPSTCIVRELRAAPMALGSKGGIFFPFRELGCLHVS